jgi:hypothetical protein
VECERGLRYYISLWGIGKYSENHFEKELLSRLCSFSRPGYEARLFVTIAARPLAYLTAADAREMNFYVMLKVVWDS